MSVASRKEFIACVTKSKAISEKKLTEWLEVVDDEDPKKIAAKLVRDKLLTAWQAKFLISGRSRLSVGNYLLRSRISRDELGDKFEAIHSQLNRKVVIQVFPSSIAKNEPLLKKLLKKLRQITELDHPNLVHIYDVDQESERYFLVTEHVEGTTLDQVSPKDLTDPEIAGIINGIASGLSYAHQSEILHGNVTAENIIVTLDGKAELQGFPSATLTSETDGQAKKISESSDFLRLAKIGSTLLKEMPKNSRTEDFSKIAAMVVGLKDDDKREASMASLDDWVTANLGEHPESSDIQLQPEDDSFVSETSVGEAGDFDSPMATVPQTTLKKKKKAKTPEPEVDERSFLNRMWEDKRAAFIACAAALMLSVFGGLGALGYALTSGSDEPAKSKVALNKKKIVPPVKDVPLATTNAAEGALSLSDRELKPTDAALDPEANRKKLAEFFAKRDGGEAVPNGDKAVSKEPNTLTRRQKNQQRRREKALAEKAASANPAQTETAASSAVPKKEENLNVSANPPSETVTPPNDKPEIVNLTMISGIADKTQAYLNDGGVTTIQQLAAMSPSDVQAALVKGNWKGPSRIKEAADWIAQAKTITGDLSPMKESTTAATAPAVAAATPAKAAKPAKAPTNSKAAAKPPAKIGNPFEKFAKLVDLPDVANTSDLKIGDLVIAQNHLLGLKLLAGPEIAGKKIDLKLNRSANDKQLWNVELGVKRSDPIAIAQFQKTPTEMKFRWLPAAAESKNKNVTALRNCMLKLSTPKDSQWLGLRKPVSIENFNFVDDQGFVKAELEIDSLPNPTALKVELQPISVNVKTEEKRVIAVSFLPRQITKREPGRIFFHKTESSRFFYVEVAADIRKKARFTAQMMLAFPNSNPQQVRSAGNLEDIARAIEPQREEAMYVYQKSLEAKKPKDMAVGEFNQLKKEAKNKSDNFTKLATVSNQNILVAKELSGKKIKLQVYFDMEGHRIIIAESK